MAWAINEGHGHSCTSGEKKTLPQVSKMFKKCSKLLQPFKKKNPKKI
jgi:hypothetical protein